MSAIENEEITKLYYTIGEVAEMFQVNHSLIRFWEREFDQLKLKKTKKGNRLFTAKDVDVMRTIYQLVKVKGHTLEGARNALKDMKPGAEVPPVAQREKKAEALLRLKTIKAQLVSMLDQL